MRPELKGCLSALAVTAAASLILLAVAACGRREAAMTTGKVYTAAEVRAVLPGFTGDDAYAEVQSADLTWLYERFRAVLRTSDGGGLVKWNPRFDCNHFACYFIAVAEANYTAAAFQSWTKAQTLALAEVWYIPDPAKPHAGHAIVAALTERGLVFLEPQTGHEIQLNPAQRKSIYLAKW